MPRAEPKVRLSGESSAQVRAQEELTPSVAYLNMIPRPEEMTYLRLSAVGAERGKADISPSHSHHPKDRLLAVRGPEGPRIRPRKLRARSPRGAVRLRRNKSKQQQACEGYHRTSNPSAHMAAVSSPIAGASLRMM